MPKILTVIGPRAFEVIRNRIAEILTDEIAGQASLTSDEDFLNTRVLIASDGPEDQQDLTVVNVSLLKGEFGERKSYDGKVKGSYLYAIDVYTNASNTKDFSSDYLSKIKCEKLIGLCFAILDNPIYRSLGYDQKSFIERVKCNDFNFRSKNKADVLNTEMGRIVFEVQADESVDLLTATVLQDFRTNLTLNTSGKGYFYEVVL